jgi:diacylglycerol kinase family enzyme
VSGIGVVVNPHAGANRIAGSERVETFTDLVGNDGIVRVTESLEAIQEVARECRDRGTEILAVCGGDGSYHCTLTGFRAVYGDAPLPMLLPLRAGTINYLADAIGGRRGKPEQVLARVVRDHRKGHTHETTERDLLRVNGREHGFVLSFGTAVNYLRIYYALDRQGPLRAAMLLSRLIVSAIVGSHISRAVFQAVSADVAVDGLPVPFRQFTFFFAATVDRIALGFRPTYLGTRKPGYMHVLGGPVSAVALVRKAVRIYRGFPTYEALLYDNLARELSIRFFRPQHWMLDGDILPPTERLDVDVPCRVTLIRA